MNYGNYNDYELVYLISENNEKAEEVIYYKYRPLINKLSSFLYKKYKFLGIEYDDLFQSGMYGLSQAIKKFDSSNENLFYTFALLIIKREMKNLVISNMAEKHMILNNSVCYDVPIFDDSNTYENILFNANQIVHNLYNKNINDKMLLDYKYDLKFEYSLVYELKLNGFSNKEISALLDIKYKDVDNYMYLSKKIIRKNHPEISIEYSL